MFRRPLVLVFSERIVLPRLSLSGGRPAFQGSHLCLSEVTGRNVCPDMCGGGPSAAAVYAIRAEFVFLLLAGSGRRRCWAAAGANKAERPERWQSPEATCPQARGGLSAGRGALHGRRAPYGQAAPCTAMVESFLSCGVSRLGSEQATLVRWGGGVSTSLQTGRPCDHEPGCRRIIRHVDGTDLLWRCMKVVHVVTKDGDPPRLSAVCVGVARWTGHSATTMKHWGSTAHGKTVGDGMPRAAAMTTAPGSGQCGCLTITWPASVPCPPVGARYPADTTAS